MSELLSVSDEVRNAVSEAVANRVSHELPGDFACVKCEMSGSTDAGDAVSVILIRHPDGDVFKFAHAVCMDSQLISDPRLLSDMIATLDGGDETSVWTRCFTFPDAAGRHRAALAIESSGGRQLMNAAGDIVDPWISSLFVGGFSLVTAIDGQLPRSKAWTLRTNRAQRTGRVVGPNLVLLDHLEEATDEWLNLAVRGQEVVVFAGTGIGLSTVSAHSELMSRLENAASEGKLLGLNMRVVNQNIAAPKRTREQQARESVASLLQAVTAERARPGSTEGKFNALPDRAPFPVRPTLHPVVAGDFPVMILDLNLPPERENEAQEILDVFTNDGMKPLRSLSDGPLALPPKKWEGYLLWRSQLLILGGEGRKVLFEQYREPQGWYENAKRYGQSMGFLVGNVNLPAQGDSQWPALFNLALEEGKLIGCALAGWCAD